MVSMWKQDSCELFGNLQTISCPAVPTKSSLTLAIVVMIKIKGKEKKFAGVKKRANSFVFISQKNSV